ncbi:MAG TPA: IPT/TIG domain-containing protein, partial [Pirellulales bacterium]|nr:IPT/TIG domain-containing protein [Pirellulales bacterium]
MLAALFYRPRRARLAVAPRRQKPARNRVCRVETLENRLALTLFGQSLFPADYPWNQNISAAPVAGNSAAIIANIGASVHIHPDWGDDNPANGAAPLYGIPFNVVHGNGMATTNVIIDNYPDESDIVPVPIPPNAVAEGDYQNGPNLTGGGYKTGQRGDSHLIVWDEDNNIAYELYGVSRPNDPTLFPNNNNVEVAKTDTAWHAAQETVWYMNTDQFRTLGATSADAAGLSILAGLARPDEGRTAAEGGQGVINHALRLTLPSNAVNPQYIYPASHVVNDSQASYKVPFGARLRLMNTPAVNSLINNMPPESQIVARAMQQYGLIVADIGTAMYVTGASATIDTVDTPSTDQVWNMDNDILASNGLKVLTASDFEVVDLTPRVTGLSATKAAAGSTISLFGQNFSGAAGHLTVFFGNTPSPTVTYVGDSQLNVVVPSGSGTVGVTVQSGV